MEHPLIAKPHEVQAILAGRQSQFRRIVKLPNGRVSKKPQLMPDYIGRWINSASSDQWAGFGSGEARPDGVQNTVNTMRTGWFACPYGKVGDRLWVREKYFPMRYDWKELPGSPILYGDGFIREREAWGEDYQGTTPPMGHAWKGAVTMPREASRLLLEVVAVRVEPVQAISREDAIAEGIDSCFEEFVPDECGGTVYRDYMSEEPEAAFMTPEPSFQSLWASINGRESWEANPWVWVVEFKVIASPTSPIEKTTPAL